MARFRSLKSDLRTRLESSDWRRELDAIAALPGKETVGPLMSFLLLGGAVKWRAAVALGLCVAGLAEAHREDARVVVRRLMWHMNEESGNIGWGIPEAMAEILASHRGLAEEYHRILISYVRDTDKDNNFCDHAPLRRSCFWAVGRLAQAWPDLARGAWEPLLAGLRDEDVPCRGAAAWALGQLIQAGQAVGATSGQPAGKAHTDAGTSLDGGSLRRLSDDLRELSGNDAEVEIFEDGEVSTPAVGAIARRVAHLLPSGISI
jgi:hypothetical protein